MEIWNRRLDSIFFFFLWISVIYRDFHGQTIKNELKNLLVPILVLYKFFLIETFKKKKFNAANDGVVWLMSKVRFLFLL